MYIILPDKSLSRYSLLQNPESGFRGMETRIANLDFCILTQRNEQLVQYEKARRQSRYETPKQFPSLMF